MRLHELTEEEQLALGGVVRLVVRRDGKFTPEESARLDQLGGYHGSAELLWSAISASSQSHKTDSEIYEAAAGVSRLEAQALLIAIADRLADADVVTRQEHDLLLRLRGLWSHQSGGGPYRQG
ncbi:MAG: hypothetical protein JRI23_27095 [Deltaproteobacteria bacterium]|jgi:alkylhydroperoxidase family enzyme|nr:hypothetical protein [Deltaproteobacteria bacterium]MBW2535749.1 hypothetical protein [Deltaproteobacteria bacterium]